MKASSYAARMSWLSSTKQWGCICAAMLCSEEFGRNNFWLQGKELHNFKVCHINIELQPSEAECYPIVGEDYTSLTASKVAVMSSLMRWANWCPCGVANYITVALANSAGKLFNTKFLGTIAPTPCDISPSMNDFLWFIDWIQSLSSFSHLPQAQYHLENCWKTSCMLAMWVVSWWWTIKKI